MGKLRQPTKSSREKYRKYLNSAKWKEIRQKVIARDKSTCQICGKKAKQDELQHFDVHHKNYKYIFREEEKLSCLTLLCRNCHTEIEKNKKIKKMSNSLVSAKASSDKTTKFVNDFNKRRTSEKVYGLMRLVKNYPFIESEFELLSNQLFERIKPSLQKKAENSNKNVELIEEKIESGDVL